MGIVMSCGMPCVNSEKPLAVCRTLRYEKGHAAHNYMPHQFGDSVRHSSKEHYEVTERAASRYASAALVRSEPVRLFHLARTHVVL